jgi:O-antigen/teichoic acid export membrane protein
MNFNKIKSRIIVLKKSSLARHTLWILFARGVRILIQAAYFVIIARNLGVEQYGAFVSVTALVNIFVPFASWGSEHILIKNVSIKRSLFAEYWGNSLLIILVSGSILVIFVILSFSRFSSSNISFLVVLFVALSDLLFGVVLKTASQAFQSVQKLNITAQIEILLGVNRLLAALCLLIFFPDKGIVIWASLYMSATAVAASIAFLLVQSYLGKPKLAVNRIKSELLQGFYFSVSISSITINNNIDKTMLARLSTLEATGIYAAAYRLIDVSVVPISSLVFASYPSFFKQGVKGIRSSVHFAQKLLPMGIAYSLTMGIAILLFAPIVPYVLGGDYATAIEALRWLALLPLLKCLYALAGNTLTGANLQGLRSAMQASAALFNVLINLWLIPLYSWKGAAWSSLASDTLLVVGFWSIITWHYWHQVNE